MRLARTVCVLYLLAFLAGCSTFFSTYGEVLNVKRSTLNVKNDPVAYAKFKQAFVYLGEEVLIDASESISLSGLPLSYRWWILEKPEESKAALTAAVNINTSQRMDLRPPKHEVLSTASPLSQRVRLKIDQPGDYRIRLVVNDGQFDSYPFDFLYSTNLEHLDRVRIVAMGDAGTGSRSQRYVGDAIAEVCKVLPCDFVLGMGDNIYNAGPKSVNDIQFEEKFERAYTRLSLPFFMVLGNHDSSGLSPGDGGFNARGQIEVDYQAYSDIWTMPDRYYEISAPLQGQKIRRQPNQNPQPLISLFALDSTPLTSAPDFVPRYRIGLYSKNMGNWLSAGLHNSRAQWKFAYAHHPYLSNGKHGNAGNYDSVGDYAEKLKKYLPKLNKYLFQRVAGTYYRDFFDQHMCGKVDMYLAGHDHNMQWLAPNERCGKTHFVISGAGAKSNKIKQANRNPAYWQCSETIGFFLFDIIADQMTTSIYRVDPITGKYDLAYQAKFSQRDPLKVDVIQGENSCAAI